MTRPARRLFAALFAAALPVAAAVAQPDDPFLPPPRKEKAPPAVPPAAKPADPTDPFAPGAETRPKGAADWGGGPAVAVPVDNLRAGVTFGPPDCPVMVVGGEVWDVKENRAVRKLVGPYEARGLRAVTADGKYFAAGSKSPNQTDTAVTVWSTETGQRVLDVPGVKDNFVDVVAFSRSKYLILGGRHNNQLDVWDVAGGKVVKKLTVPDRRVDGDKLAFTPDGRFFAYLAHEKLVVTSTATGQAVGIMTPPGAAPAGPPVKGAAARPGRPTRLDATFVYAWVRGLVFSPDGTELAAFSTHPTPRLMVWDTKGRLTLDEAVPMPLTVSPRSDLEWLSDGSGWLVNGYLFGRSTKRVLMSIRVPFASDVRPHLIDRDRLMGVFGEDRDRLRAVTIPWDRLNAAAKAMATKAPAFLAPGDPVTIDVSLAGARGNEAETKAALTDALKERLARDGVPVGIGRPTVFRLRLAEEAGDTLPIFERQSPFDIRGTKTGKTATEAKGAAVLELTAAGEEKPLWRAQITALSARSFKEEVTNAAVRKSMIEDLTRQLNSTDIPYFIPKAADILALPAVIE